MRAANPGLYTLDTPTALPAVLEELAATPAALREACARLSPLALGAAAAPGEWSPFQTVCHFRDAALVYSIRFRWMVFDVDPFLPNYDENNWVESAVDRPDDLSQVLDEIAASRSDLMRLLTRLDAAGWERTGRHEVLGPVVLEDYVRHQLAHERAHLGQVAAART